MIQRIQTIYLLLTTILLCFLFGIPYADINSDGQLYTFSIKGITQNGTLIENGLSIAIFIAILVILHFIVIFKYKKRLQQVRMLIFSIFLMLGLVGLFFFFVHYSFDNEEVSYKMAMVFPIVAIILDYLAIRAIGKDEALIRSIDRIR